MSPAAGPLRHLRAHPGRLVGRDRESILLHEHFAAAMTGQTRLLLIGGEAGIGKTALVASLVQEAVAREVCVLLGACYELTTPPPYGPWRGLTSDVAPELLTTPAPALFQSDDALAEVSSQGALFAQVRDYLAAMAARRPTIIVLEDLHWAEPASLDLLRFVAREVADAPLLLIATYRADEVTRRDPLYEMLPVLVREAGAHRLELRPLSETAVRDLVSHRYQLPADDEERLVAFVQSRAEGNPFYIREVLRTLEEERLLHGTADRWHLEALDHAPLPALLRQIVDSRVARLGDAARDLLARAAVIGHEVPLDLWSAISNLPEEQLLAVAERAVEAHLLDAGHDDHLRFRHALIREALYESILPLRRRGWHRLAGEALAARRGPSDQAPDPDVVAHHFQQARDERAREWLERAADRAQRSYAWLTAADRLAAASTLLADDPTSTGARGWLLYRMGRLVRFSDPGRGIAYFEAAERAGIAAGDPVLAAYALADRGASRCVAGQIRRGLDEMASGEAALAALPIEHVRANAAAAFWVADTRPHADHASSPPIPGITPREGTRVIWLANVGRLDEARTLGEMLLAQIPAHSRLHGDALSTLSDARHGLALVYAAQGQVDAARLANTQARNGHLALGHHIQVAFDLLREIVEILLPYAPTELAERRHLAAEAAATWTRVGGAMATDAPAYLAFCGHGLALRLHDGDWDDARALERATRGDNLGGLWQYAAGDLAALARHQGDVALAEALVREVLPAGPATEPGATLLFASLTLQRVAAELALDTGDLSLAEAWLDAHDRWLAWAGAVRGQAEGRLLQARLHRQAGDLARAGEEARAALALASAPTQPLAQLAIHRFLGELATRQRKVREAEEHLQAAGSLADACGAPFERVLTLLAHAELHAARGEPAAALPLLDEVRVVCLRLGAGPTLQRADAVQAAMAAPVVPATPSGPGTGLSTRELQVLRLVAHGLTDAEVGARLAISPRTVGQHLRSIYNKLGVSSRAAATRIAVERDLL